jgi:hypothetical protein
MLSFVPFRHIGLMWLVFVMACDSSIAKAEAGSPTVAELCRRFRNYDQNRDGVVEIQALKPIAHGGASGGRLLVLVEQRLLERYAGLADLTPHIRRLVADLGAEGYRADAIAIELGHAKIHQDGRYLLALRELLRAVKKKDQLAGVILLGHFPDAYLVRTCNWRRSGTIALHKKQESQKSYENVPYLRRVPEEVACRADVVLADLDGRWEDVYVQPQTQLEAITAVFPDGVPPKEGLCADIERRFVAYEDFFHIADGQLAVREVRGSTGKSAPSILLVDENRDHECGLADRGLLNVIARPDIRVSRLDARDVALRPRRDVVGVDGCGLLDAQGKPRAVRFASKEQVPNWREAIWEPDPQLERRLLVEYLSRNHAFRTRSASVAWRPASFACELRSGYREVCRAADDWKAADPAKADIHGHPSVAQFVDWLRYPAVLRTLRAHSDPQVSQLGKGDIDELDARVGGPAWSWARRGDRLEPSLTAACGNGTINWFLLHTLWENRAIAPEPAFYIHTGCNGISPSGAEKLPYDHPAYGRRQGAESLLFFANGLALVGRAKVYYDEPREFSEVFGQGRTFGDAWAHYYEIESTSPQGGDIGRKRAYYWSVLGDWTLRLARPETNHKSRAGNRSLTSMSRQPVRNSP